MMTKAPRWATRQKAKRVELKAARLAALYLLRDELGGTPKTHMAEALGISRWTYDRLLASLSAVDVNIEIVKRAIKQEMQTMNEQIAIADGTYTPEQLARLVAEASERGDWYDGENGTNILDWITEGDYSGDETIASLAAEWDA